MSANFLPHLLLFLVNLIYAGNYTVAKIAMPKYIPAEPFIVLRAFVGMLTFLLIHSLFIKEKIQREDWPRLVICGLFGVAVNQLMFFKGLSLTSPINASLIMIMVPIIVLVLTALVLRERVTFIKILGVLFGLSGATMIILSSAGNVGLKVSVGDLFIFINATGYGIYLVLVKDLMRKYQPFTVMRWVFLFGLIMVLPFGARQVLEIDWVSFPRLVWFSIAYVLIGTTVLAYLFNTIALKTSTATMVSTYIYLQPLLATLIAVVAGKDLLTKEKIIAGLLIFVGVYLVSFGHRLTARMKVSGTG